MRQKRHHLTAEIRPAGAKWEFRIFAKGQLITWRRFAEPAAALAYADLFQRDLVLDGWQSKAINGRGFGSR